MANVSQIKGLNFEDGNSILLAVFGNDVAKYNSSTGVWDGQHQNLTPNIDYSIAKGKGYGFFTGINVAPRVINSSGTWSQTTNLTNAPWAKYCYLCGDRIYFSYCLVNSDYYRRRTFYTDIIENENAITWGLEYGTDLVQTAASAVITSASSLFNDVKIKIGDPFIILSGNNAGAYSVKTVTSNTSITLDRNLTYSATSSKFLVGGNWFDISGEVTGIGEYYNTILSFESQRAWRWSYAIGKKEIIGVKGTTSFKSIVSNHRGYTFWYNPNDGIVQFNGSTATSISEKIEPILSGMSSTMYTSVVGWPGTGKYKNHVYFYVGDSTFSVNGESFTLNKVILDYNILRSKWKVHEFNAVVTSATVYTESGEDNVYLGTSSSLVLKFNTGNHDYNVTTDDAKTLPIHSYMVTHPIYPSGIEVINQFDKHYVWADKGTGIKSKYKLHGTVDKNDSDWSELSELNEKYAEVKIDPQNSQSRGMSFMISEISKDPSFEFLGFSIIYSVLGEAFTDEL